MNKEGRRSTWRALIRAKNEGLVKDIGVSNFMISHLEDPCFQAPKHDHDKSDHINEYNDGNCFCPAVNQVECHPACPQIELRQYCEANQIVVQAYSSLCCGDNDIFSLKDLTDAVASSSVHTEGLVNNAHQLLLTWALQQNIPILPKSSNRERIYNNYNFIQIILKKIEDSINSNNDTCFMKATAAFTNMEILPQYCLQDFCGRDDRHLCWDSRKVA